ncbi:DUF58 domain-containing protein [Clostridium arbusti]|uniref:DUF58 domain-containing protein n=1 Tax=Clostridium arbusti TaxID=1137848 RepID=UPI0002881222|nr:DUF58 domain-containing protein [Clostridium arbusti]
MIKFKLSFILTLALLIGAHYFYGKEIVNSLLLVFLSMFLIALLSLLFLKRHITVHLNSEDKKFFTGENLKIYLYIHNKSLFIYSCVNFLSNFIDKKDISNKSFSLLPFKKLKMELNFELTTRGIYNFKNYLLEVQDMFLIFSKKLNFNNGLTIIIYPKDIELPLGIEKLIDSVINSSKDNINFYTPDDYSHIDKYILGDNFKNIHWKISAKTNTLYTKRFDALKKQDIQIYMDMNNCSLLPDTFNNITDENLISFSLSIIKYLLQKNESICLNIENSNSSIFQLQSIDDYNSIVSYYLKHKSTGEINFFNKVLEKTLGNIQDCKFLFIITYTILPHDLKIISKIAANHDSLIIFTLLNVPYKTKDLLSNISVKVVTLSI